ncbi:hypothetical protein L226DRAFT_572188 [Lentinus tigrinus ALCF2SS1-7]|uniref:BTB domain-containing protein n=1 Tax=Lentinus tigrinus ALCF2SS1-6 TaxID=1328759 RepID=A0A5C2S7S9_9APHY|nr:hypothetical protein L227DRAFT_654200 [Lentinus tigrinus ALCF2SS1-6]RPD73515.1 hypothetical protein L226DRAFT_572188 [Lentinus tigrinus ALCF2SS1-7]
MNEPLTSVEAALAASLNPGSVRDICLYAFSKKSKSNGVVKIHRPLPVVAVGSVLKKTARFADVLGLASTDYPIDSGQRRPQDQQFAILQAGQGSGYDYESDSDLDEEEQNDSDCLSKDGLLSESIDLSAVGAKHVELEEVKTSQDVSKYRAIMVPNVAYRTLRAGVFFMYTGKVRFLPLRSQGIEKRQNELRALESAGIPACSPKALYRFADTFDMKDLRQCAANAITHRLSPENIVDEVFSSFFCRYEDLHRRAMNIIGFLYDNPAVQQSLQRLIPRIVKGELPHAGPTLVALFRMQKINAPRRVGRVATELAAQSTPGIHDGSSLCGTTLNASAQSFQPKELPSTTSAFSLNAPDPSTSRSTLKSPVSRPRGPEPRPPTFLHAPLKF